MDRENRSGRTANQYGCNCQQPGKRQHQWFQAPACGFRRFALSNDSSARAQSSEQTTLPSGLQIGTGVRPVATERLHSQGNLSQTNNSKDVAIKGQGFFQVQLPDGTSAYTRDGSFQVDQNGQLVTAGGFQVQPAITIPANALSITIGRDGIVSVTQQGQAAPVQVGQLNLTTFMNDTGLESIGENLYTETQSSGTPNESTPA